MAWNYVIANKTTGELLTTSRAGIHAVLTFSAGHEARDFINSLSVSPLSPDVRALLEIREAELTVGKAWFDTAHGMTDAQLKDWHDRDMQRTQDSFNRPLGEDDGF